MIERLFNYKVGRIHENTDFVQGTLEVEPQKENTSVAAKIIDMLREKEIIAR